MLSSSSSEPIGSLVALTEHGARALSATGAASGAGLAKGRAARGELRGDIRDAVARRAGGLAVLAGSLIGQRQKGKVVDKAILAQ